jgi:protein SCO1/2
VSAPRLVAVVAAALALAGPASAAEPLPGEAARAARQRAYFTDTELLTQDARPVRFFSDVLEGQVVVLSFMFARCAEACPLLCSKLNQVRRQLGGAIPKGVRFVTLSVDPEHDTPLELKRFAERQQAVDDAWLFLTGGKGPVKLVVGKLGQWVDDPGDHSTAFIAGNTRTNHWTKIRPDAPPSAIVAHIRLLLAENEPGAGARPTAALPDPAPAAAP